MKKVALSLAGVLAAAAFAPEASAIPAFARQSGMACNACHAQHFPVLNSFGRAFKASGFTLMGSQGKIEGEHLSIPDVLNGAVLMKARFQKTDGAVGATEVPGTTTNSGQWQIPDELSLFFGGRVAEGEKIKVGMMMENNLVGGPLGGIIAGIRVPVVVDLGAASLSVIPYITDSLGPMYGYTESSTGVNRAIRWAEHRKEISAHQYTGIGNGAASGFALVVRNDIGYVNVSRWTPQFAYTGGSNGVRPSSTVLSAAWTPTIADWSAVIGGEIISGSSYCSDAPTLADACNTEGTGMDAQAHGEIAGIETGLYATYAIAPHGKNGRANMYNSSTTNAISAATVGADFTVIPHTLSLGGAYRSAKTNTAKTDNAITVTAIYDLFQNVALHANYSMYSGDKYNGTPANGKSLLTLMLESAW
jgi:hypothetical protein